MTGRDPLDPAEVMMANDLASAALGMEVIELSAGHAVVRMAITAAMVNGHDIAHGGYLFLLADTAFACACNSGRSTTVAAGADIDFLAPARLGDVLEATADERVAFGRSGITDVTVRRLEDGVVMAEFRGRSRQLRAPSA